MSSLATMQVLKRAQETPRFVRKAAEALQAYRAQMAEAAQAVQVLTESAQQMAWLRRPSPDLVCIARGPPWLSCCIMTKQG